MKVLLINTVCGIGSTGKICLELAKEFEESGSTALIAYGRGTASEDSKKYAHKIGSNLDQVAHGLKTRVFDGQGRGSILATKEFLDWAEEYNPDLLWLHNIHGYYINYKLLFEWIKSRPQMQVKWTLHDCWAFTGHCAYFSSIGCEKWKNGCYSCSQKIKYPSSLIFDNSNSNYIRKKEAFSNIKNLTIIAPSKWLANLVSESFLKEYPIEIKYNKINYDSFHPVESTFKTKYGLENRKIILGVADGWDERKGFEDFLKLSTLIDSDYIIVLIGVSKSQIKRLPENIIGLEHINNTQDLVEIYSAADVLFNPTYEDNYPSVNLEAEACGTRVITYNTGGSPETLHRKDSKVISIGNLEELIKNLD